MEKVTHATANFRNEMVRMQAFYLRCPATQIKPSIKPLSNLTHFHGKP